MKETIKRVRQRGQRTIGFLNFVLLPIRQELGVLGVLCCVHVYVVIQQMRMRTKFIEVATC